MPTATAIIKEHRKAASQLRRELRSPKKARAFLIRGGFITKSGTRLTKRYR